jgi:hypothetical protein
MDTQEKVPSSTERQKLRVILASLFVLLQDDAILATRLIVAVNCLLCFNLATIFCCILHFNSLLDCNRRSCSSMIAKPRRERMSRKSDGSKCRANRLVCCLNNDLDFLL